jgi:hypothetical protein
LSRQLVQADKDQKAQLDKINRLSTELASSADKKATWIEFTSAITQALPRDPRINGAEPIDAKEIPYESRTILYVDELETIFDSDIETWQKEIKPIYDAQFETSLEKLAESSASVPVQAPTGAAAPPAAPGASSFLQQANQAAQPAVAIKTGYRVELKGHHYHNSEEDEVAGNSGKSFLLKTLIDKLVNGEMELPGSEEEGGGKFKFSDFGILSPTIVRRSGMPEDYIIMLDEVDNPNAEIVGGGGEKKDNAGGDPQGGNGRPPAGGGAPGGGAAGQGDRGNRGGAGAPAGEGREAPADAKSDKNQFKVRRFNFVVQMAWIPRSPAERVKARAERLEREKAEAAAKAAAPAGDAGGVPAGAVPAPGAPPAVPPASVPAIPPAAPAAGDNDD